MATCRSTPTMRLPHQRRASTLVADGHVAPEGSPVNPSVLVTAVGIVLPVYYEVHDLEASVSRLHGYVTERFPFTFQTTIANNASTDATADAAGGATAEAVCALALRRPQVRSLNLTEKGPRAAPERGVARFRIGGSGARRPLTRPVRRLPARRRLREVSR